MLLAAKGFDSAYNMAGGLKAYKGATAAGPVDFGLENFIGDQDFDSAFSMALSMEGSLQKFYLALADDTPARKLREMLLKLASFEEGHIKRLLEKCPECRLQEHEHGSGMLEGGLGYDESYAKAKEQISTPEELLEFAMMLETQAMDLYARMAEKSINKEAQELFLDLSHEEKAHLDFLEREMNKILET